MSSKLTAAAVAALLALMLVSAACAQGTPNLGTNAIGAKTQVTAEARVFDTSSDQDTFDNTVWSLGFTSPIQENLEFGLIYSQFDATGPDPIADSIRRTQRRVLSPTIKWALSDKFAITAGADIAVRETFASNIGVVSAAIGDYDAPTAIYDSVTPGVRAQWAFMKIGRLQLQAAGQVAFWEDSLQTNVGDNIDGFGTVCSLGGGAVLPLGSRLTLMGDAMFPVSGENVVDDVTGDNDTELVWSAGGQFLVSAARDIKLSVYATNSMQPTIGASIIATPSNSIGVGVGLSAGF
jgi:hypothetical protein